MLCRAVASMERSAARGMDLTAQLSRLQTDPPGDYNGIYLGPGTGGRSQFMAWALSLVVSCGQLDGQTSLAD